ncbi:uncharacterized protein DDB_G0271670-like isoform X2 [Cotesia glomerata]|uniref:Uncharacterized protein n=1 Tax=Cotesia glomerata TaxID=32391 RepID=A0AAV7I3R0_COTGL|nr:uncharacterized protein DDB_G0271670-like isoform X2 [Cotesia glomerata]KAH0545615.1 hypothetical protein KQX54_001699 [Cotesia glomerata]
MKVIIILSIATSVTLGSLEPAGYKPPLGSRSPSGYSTTGQSDRYLPPSLSSQLASHRSISNQGLTPESHYLPTSYQSPSQNVIPNSLYLPTSNIRSSSLSSLSTLSGIPNSSSSSSSSSGTSVVGGIPSLQYLPSQPSISRQNPFNSIQNPESITTTSTTATGGITSTLDHRISNSLGIPNTPTVSSSPTVTSRLHTLNRNTVGSGTAVSSSQYLPPSMSLVSTSKHSDRFIQSVPSSNYLASAVVSKQNQYHGRINQPSSTSAVAVPGSIGLSSPPSPSSSSSSSSSTSSSSTSSGIISNSYLTPNKLSSSLLSQNNQYIGTSTAISGQPGRQSNILVGGNINQPPGNYYSSDETFSGYDNNHKALANYEFEYHVNDEYGNDFSHKETKNDDNKVTRGVYTVLLPDGRKQIVHYTADQDGFKPTITYEESPAPGYQY